ncbi:sulfotransferase 1E1-like isoform X2 [Asterias amurensis]|uniref:sulfotransferase 1E1-like isoform X2 n=1 Tax=Asterias amurensis TaxID=7602 RepID=UPI003AB7AFDF
MVDWEEFQRKVLTLPRIDPAEGENLEYFYKGVCVSKGVPKEVLIDLETFEVRNDDIFLITYPKSGTTWMQQMISLIINGCDAEEHKNLHVFFRFPFLENIWVSHHSQIGLIPPTHTLLNKMPRDKPRLIKTHLQPNLLPKQMFEKTPKVVYVARNPKDVAVSYYYMHQFDTSLQTYASWDKFIERFLNKSVLGGDWFQHNLFWWNRRQDPNVLFIKYEDMQKDQRSAVQMTANFLGRTLTTDMLDRIDDLCRFQNMKRDPAVNPDLVLQFRGEDKDSMSSPDLPTDSSFMRKGQVGDWKNHLTVSQNETFDAIYHKEVHGTNLKFDFEL